MTRLLRRATAREDDVLEDLRREGVALRVRRRCTSHRHRAVAVHWRGDRTVHGRSRSGRELLDERGDPGVGVVLVVHVALDAIQQTLRAELFEALVEDAAGGAVVLVGGVAEREDGEAHALELGGALALHELEEVERGRRRLALAVRGGDDQDVLLVLEAARLVVGEIGDLRRDALRLGGRREHAGKLLRVAGIVRVDDAGQACGGRSGGGLEHRAPAPLAARALAPFSGSPIVGGVSWLRPAR